jgi:hypothetical protein
VTRARLLRLALLIVLAGAVYLGRGGDDSFAVPDVAVERPIDGASAVAEAFREHASDVQVQGSGIVERLLRDDLEGGRHQRFVLRVGERQTVLVAHNIDLAPRLDGLKVGDVVEFAGEYEWNPQGGVLHWTHHDPSGRHVDGWLDHGGRRYQ